MKRIYQLAAAIIYVALFFLLFPLYKYILDADGISYIHVADLIAKGEYYNSINACWSPLASWLLVPFIKMGFDPILSAKYLNGFLGLLTLYSCYILTDKFKINEAIKKILPFPIALLMLSFCFYELCADLLVFFLLTLYINLILSKNFIEHNYKIMLAGVLGAIGYYAKAYCFPFFLIHFFVTLIALLKKYSSNNFMGALIKKAAIAFIIFFVLVMPYIIVLSAKYGSLQVSSAGKLNVSWALSDVTDNAPIAIQPPYNNSSSYWDDPTFYNQDKFVGPFTSFKYFTREIRWVFYNCFKYFDVLNQISIFSILIFVSFFIYLAYKKKEISINEWLLFITAVIYQIGYPFIYIEWRYAWLVTIMLLLMTGIILSHLLDKKIVSKKIIVSVAIIISLSFMHKPLNELKTNEYYNKDAFEIAEIFNKNNIKGNFFFLNFQKATLFQKQWLYAISQIANFTALTG